MRSITTPSRARRRAAGDSLQAATVRVGPALAVPEVLRSLGVDPVRVLRELGLKPALFDSPDNLIAHAARGRLFGHCVERTGCRHFGLLVGQQAGLQSMGLVGLLMKHSADVGTALRSLVRHFRIHARGAAVNLDVDGDRATLSHVTLLPRLEPADQVGDGAVAAMFNAMRQLCGRHWIPLEARFAHRAPEDVAPFRRFFGCRVVFNAEQYGLVFSADWLRHPLPGTDPELRRLLQQHVETLASKYGDDFPGQVRSVLRSVLLTDDASADRVAGLFAMHSRTLNRRLHGFGTGFRELVDEGRFEISCQLLEDSSMEVGRIAETLGYADASAFTRAFRRWSGTTPTDWRLQRGARMRRRE